MKERISLVWVVSVRVFRVAFSQGIPKLMRFKFNVRDITTLDEEAPVTQISNENDVITGLTVSFADQFGPLLVSDIERRAVSFKFKGQPYFSIILSFASFLFIQSTR
jgi:hypothetical protein